MKIIIKPSDIVKLCLFDNFAFYVIGSNDKAASLLEEDKEFELSHNDALVIGLLKVIETDHLVFKFNDYIVHLLMSKSFNYGDNVYIRKKMIDNAVDSFMNKFPKTWKPEANFQKRMDDLRQYIDNVKQILSELEVDSLTVKNKTFEVYRSTDINKSLEFVHY